MIRLFLLPIPCVVPYIWLKISLLCIPELCTWPGHAGPSCRASPACWWGSPGTARRSGRASTSMSTTPVRPCRAWAGPKYCALVWAVGPRALWPSIDRMDWLWDPDTSSSAVVLQRLPKRRMLERAAEIAVELTVALRWNAGLFPG